MKNKLVVNILIITLLSSFVGFNLSVEGSVEVEIKHKNLAEFQIPQFENVVLITYDGASPKFMDKYIDDGSLVNIKRILDGGGYRETVRITSHKTNTDSSLSTIESGYGPEIHGISSNTFGSAEKPSVPDSLTISERLNNSFGDTVKTGFFFAWAMGPINVTYMAQEEQTDSIFFNMKTEVDYWFASENLTWQPDDLDSREATFHGFDEGTGLYKSPVITSNFLGKKAAEWIPTVQNDRFYLRMHFTDPDQAAHGYGDTSPEYKQAFIEGDIAIGMVLDELEDADILDETLVMLGTDHGMASSGHTSGPWPDVQDMITEQRFVISHPSIRHEESIPVSQQDIAPTILAVMGVDLATLTPAYIDDDDTGIPFWEKTDDTAPRIKNAYFKTDDMDEFGLIIQGAEIKGKFDLKLYIIEWSPLRTATVQIGDNIINADLNSSKSVLWNELNPKEIGDGIQTLSFTLIDPFGNEATDDISLTLTAPAAFWASILPIIAVSTILVLRRKKK